MAPLRLLRLALLSYVVSASLAGGRTPAGAETCQTPECLSLSAMITRNMNLSANPCEDFVAYACGNYGASTLYDPGAATWSRFSGEPTVMQTGANWIRSQMKKRVFELLYSYRRVNSSDPGVNLMYRLARDLFRSCSSWVRQRGQQFKDPDAAGKVSQNFFDGLLDHLLDDINRQDSNFTFETALSKMVRPAVWNLIKVGPSVVPSFRGSRLLRQKSTAKVRLVIDVDRLSKKTNYTKVNKFFSSLPSAARLNLSHPGQFSTIIDEIKTRATVEGDISGEELQRQWPHCSALTELLDHDGMDFTVRQLDALSRCASPDDPFSWTLFFDGVLDGSVDQDTPIQVRTGPMNAVTYAVNAVQLATYLKRRALRAGPDSPFSAHYSFLLVDWMLSFYKYLPADLRFQWSENRWPSNVPDLDSDPIDSCLTLTEFLLLPVVERMYQRAYNAEYFEGVRRLVELVQNATIENVQKQGWITQSAKLAIEEKLKAMRQEIGFDVLSADQLKTFYASTIRSLEASDKSKRSFGTQFSLALCAFAGRQNNLLSSDSPPSFLKRYGGLTVNAFSDKRGNQIIFPMGILAPFLYHHSYPEYINIAGIGAVIGHEIGHGFDDLGHELNKKGVRGHFWDNATEAGYLERMKCVEARYGKYELVPGKSHFSRATRGNDIADLMGIQSAFTALQLQKRLSGDRPAVRLPRLPDSLTPDRLFFIHAAQAHCSKAEPEVVTELFLYQMSKHSPPHIRIQGMLENSDSFASVFQCKPDLRMNPSDKCVFW